MAPHPIGLSPLEASQECEDGRQLRDPRRGHRLPRGLGQWHDVQVAALGLGNPRNLTYMNTKYDGDGLDNCKPLKLWNFWDIHVKRWGIVTCHVL